MSIARTITGAFAGILLLAGAVGAQNTGAVAGRVIDASTQQPVVGATVTVADVGGLTNTTGRFLITGVPAGPQTVRVRQIGYAEATQEVTVAAGQTATLEFALTSQAIGLGELVVTTGYGEQEANELTGVIDAITPEQFNPGRVISPENLFQGKVAGVNVIDSGEPGGGVQIRIRGGTSITSSNEPLFVVDGQPLAVGGGVSAGRNPLNFLNPEDIQRVTILKDASATAIYGSRGANGVIIIETKGGRDVVGGEGSRLTYTGSMSGSTVVGEPEVLTAEQFRSAVQQYAPSVAGLLGSEQTDWRDAVQRTGFGQEHTVGFAGATRDMSYRLSVGYLNQEGVIRGSETERATLSLDYGQGFYNDLVRLNANVKGSRTNDDFTPGGVVGGATAFAPTQPIYDPSSPFGGYFEWSDYQQALNNPVAELELSTDEGTSLRSVGNLEGKIQAPFAPELVGTVRLGYDVVRADREVFRPSFLRGEAEGGTPGFVSRSNSAQTNVLLDAFLNYGHQFDALATDADFTAGYSYEDFNSEFPYFEARGLSFDLLGTSGIPAAAEQRTSMWVDESRLVSFFGRTHLTMADRFMLTLSVRRDGSSRFGPDNQWGTFPSAAFAWRISDESFMQGIDLISDLKLRASWGVNGNQAIGNYLQYPSYNIGEPTAQYQFGDEFVTTIRPGAADRNIKWEETTSYNFGLDFGLAGNRFGGSIDYYFKDTDDLIFRVPVAAGTFTSNFITTNIGSVQNQGIEFSLDGRIIDGRGGDFWWDAGFNAAYNANEIVQINPFGGGDVILTGGIAGGVGNFIQVLQTGQPINTFYVYQHIRGSDGLPIYEDRNNDGTIDENDLYKDVDGDGFVNQNDRIATESAAPDWIFGHTSRMGWRNFDAGFTMRAHLGNYVYNNVASNFGHYRALSYVGAPNNLHASVLETGFESEQYFSDYYLEDASFLRMDNLTLGYTFVPAVTGQEVRVFGTVQNVFTLTGYSGVDPLAGLNGIDNNLYPRSRTFMAGATVRF